MDIIVTIPIRSHLKKFMQLYTSVNPYRISIRDQFGRIIFNELENPTIYYYDEYKENEGYKDFNETIDVCIPSVLWQRRYKFIVTKNTVKNIDCFLHNLFKSHFRTTMFFCNNVAETKKADLIRYFLQVFNITPDDIEFDTLKKDFYRFEQSFTVKNVPSFNQQNKLKC